MTQRENRRTVHTQAQDVEPGMMFASQDRFGTVTSWIVVSVLRLPGDNPEGALWDRRITYFMVSDYVSLIAVNYNDDSIVFNDGCSVLIFRGGSMPS